jgi:ketosteroid isomerase-like protein
MSRQNVEIVRDLHAALNSGDEEKLQELIDPAIDWVQNPNAPDPRRPTRTTPRR